MTEQVQRSPAVAIANAVVQIHKEAFGKGPTRARARLADDLIVVELEDVLTRAELTLVDAGRKDQVRENRQIFHQAQRDQFVSAVEEVTGRKVRAFMSQVHFNPDIAIEVFLLEPEAGEA